MALPVLEALLAHQTLKFVRSETWLRVGAVVVVESVVVGVVSVVVAVALSDSGSLALLGLVDVCSSRARHAV